MTRLDLLNRTIIAVALVGLGVTLGVWLVRSPLSTSPAAVPVPPSIKPTSTEALAQPTLAPPAPPAVRTPTATTTEVQIEVEIVLSPDASVGAEPVPGLRSAAKSGPAVSPAERQPASPPRRNRGLFRRRPAIS